MPAAAGGTEPDWRSRTRQDDQALNRKGGAGNASTAKSMNLNFRGSSAKKTEASVVWAMPAR